MTSNCRRRSRCRASLDPAEIGGAKCAVSFSRLLRREVFRQARRDVLGAPIDADLFTAGQAAFEILRQNTGGAEPADQLPTRFRTQFGAALVDQDGGSDIAKTACDPEPTIGVGQGLRAIR